MLIAVASVIVMALPVAELQHIARLGDRQLTVGHPMREINIFIPQLAATDRAHGGGSVGSATPCHS